MIALIATITITFSCFLFGLIFIERYMNDNYDTNPIFIKIAIVVFVIGIVFAIIYNKQEQKSEQIDSNSEPNISIQIVKEN